MFFVNFCISVILMNNDFFVDFFVHSLVALKTEKNSCSSDRKPQEKLDRRGII